VTEYQPFREEGLCQLLPLIDISTFPRADKMGLRSAGAAKPNPSQGA